MPTGTTPDKECIFRSRNRRWLGVARGFGLEGAGGLDATKTSQREARDEQRSWRQDFYEMTVPPSRHLIQRYLLEIFCILFTLPILSCKSPPSLQEARPFPVLASSTAAANAFGELRRRWASSSRMDRKALRDYVLTLRQTFHGEDVVRQADLYLAWIALEYGDFQEARSLAKQASAPHSGNVRLMAHLVEGAALSRSGAPEEALAELLPLVGQLIDVYARELLYEEAVISAITAHQWQDALWLLDLWLRDAPEEDQPTILNIVKTVLPNIPASSIEDELTRRSHLQLGEVHAKTLEKILFRRLATVALERQDSSLARRLLQRTEALPLLGEDAAAILGLAARHDVPQVNGRQIGLYFPDDHPELVERGGALSLGAMNAIQSLREGAPRLVVRQGATKKAANTLSNLDAEGVLVIIGGTDPESAEQLARFAEQEQIAVLMLVPPKTPPQGRWAMYFGPDLEQATQVILSTLAKQNPHQTVFIGSTTHPLKAHELAVPCQALPPPGQLTRYPLRSWKAQGVDTLVLLGSSHCARDVLEELQDARTGMQIVMGLEAASLLQPPPIGMAPTQQSPRGTAVGLGCYPEITTTHKTPEGTPGYWQRLAESAVLAAAHALEGLPLNRTLEDSEVKQRRESVRIALEHVEPTSCLNLRPTIRMNPLDWHIVEHR